MKVMHLTCGFNTSGVTAGVMCLVKNGFYDYFDDFRIVGEELGDEKVFDSFKDLLKPGQIAYIADKAPKSQLSLIRSIRQEIEDFCPDALVLSTSRPVILGRLAARLYPNVKIVTFEHHTLTHLPEKRRRALRKTSVVNDVIWADTPTTLEVTRRTLYNDTLGAQPAFVVPLAIAQLGSARPAEEIDGFRLLSLGRLDGEKNYRELIGAMAILFGEGYRFHLTIAGKGKQHKELRELARSLGVADCVSLPGYIEDTASLREAAHIYVQPSLTEGLCLSFIEAAAAGMVVVGTDVGGMKDYGIDNHNMTKIQGFDRQAIADALRRTFDNYAQNAFFLSQRAMSMAAGHFGEPAVKAAWRTAAQALHDLCAPRRQIVTVPMASIEESVWP